VELALQAPAGSNVARVRFVVVLDPALKSEIGRIYREIYYGTYVDSPAYIGNVRTGDAQADAQQQSTARSADALAEVLAEVPAIVIGCLAGARVDGASAVYASSLLGGALPAMWSFMLAARARSLGTCWTTMHLAREREVAELLGIPFDDVQQFCLTPLAFTIGTEFKRARRPPVSDAVHWDGWQDDKALPPPLKRVLDRA
jgi:nitroreductase